MQFPTTSLLLLATTMATTALSSPLSLFSRQASSGPFLVDAVTTSGATLPNTFYPALSYVYSTNTIYTGNIKYHPASEPLRLQGGTASGGFSFLSYHSSPTGYVRMYAFESGTNDLGLTVPHSGAVPAGARIDGWAISEEGGKITFLDNDVFTACPVPAGTVLVGSEVGEGSYVIGTGEASGEGCVEVNLVVRDECAAN